MADTRKLIKSNWFTPVSIKQIEGKAPPIIVQNFVDQGLAPTAESDGILASLQNYPLAYYDTPTANKQIFQRALWQGLKDNPDILFRMHESKSFFGEPSHQDSLEVLLPQVSHRVTDFDFVNESPLVLGSVDLLDTPMGNIIHSLMKSSWIGISSRGYGNLVDAGDGENQIVSASDYLHVCWDFVGVPAVKEAMATISGYAKSHKIVEPIVHALLVASKHDALWGDLARIVQSDNTHKTVVVEKKPVKSSKGWDWNTDRYGGLSITLDGKDVAYLQGDEANQLDDELEAAKTEEDVQRILDQYSVLLESKKAVTSASRVYPNKDTGKFYFDINDRPYGPFDTEDQAIESADKAERSGLFANPQFRANWTPEHGPGKEAGHTTKATSSKSPSEVPMPTPKSPIKSEDASPTLDLPPAPETSVEEAHAEEHEFSPDEQTDRKEFDKMVLLELAETLAETGGADVTDEEAGFDFGEDDLNYPPVKESVTPVKSSFDDEDRYPTTGDNVSYDGQEGVVVGIDEKSSDPDQAGGKMLVVKLKNGKTVRDWENQFILESRKPVLSESDPDVASPESSDKGDEDLGEENAFFPEEDLGAVTVDEASSTITVETTSADGDAITVDLKLEDGFLTQEGGTLVDLDNDQEAGEDNQVIPDGVMDLFEESNGDVSAAVDLILDLPNGANDLSNIIDLTEGEGGDDMGPGSPETEDIASGADPMKGGKTFKQPTSKKPATPKPIPQAALDAAERNALPKGEFAEELDRAYPVDTPERARSALARVKANGTPAEQETVRRKVKEKYPQMNVQ